MTDPLAWLGLPCRPIDRNAAEAARARQDQLTKPRGALGRLETLAIRLAGLQGRSCPTLDPVQCVLFAGDHGVAAEGVSLYPQAVTVEMIRNIARGGAAISVLARSLGARLEVIDCGSLTDPGPILGVRSERVGPGTGNIAREPAMTSAQLVQALAIGREAAERAAQQGCGLVIGGEMGIGNTSPSAALACALLGRPAADLVGPGTGLDRSGVAHKAQVVAAALNLHAPPEADPAALMERLGGFEIAALAGYFLRSGQLGMAVLLDGFIASAAALWACRANPGLRDWLFFAHQSAEPGHRLILDALDADPLLDLGMRLGEGSGAAVALPLLRAACALHGDMATFAEAGVTG